MPATNKAFTTEGTESTEEYPIVFLSDLRVLVVRLFSFDTERRGHGPLLQANHSGFRQDVVPATFFLVKQRPDKSQPATQPRKQCRNKP